MQPSLFIHGETLSSYNDGSFYIERRSTRRPSDWVSRDTYPRASLEVWPKSPFCCHVKLILCASANGRDILGRSLFKPKSSAKCSLSDLIVTSTTSGRKKIEKYLFGCALLANGIRSIWSASIMIECMSLPLNFRNIILNGYWMKRSLWGNVSLWDNHHCLTSASQNPGKKHVV